jgi:hypothetical protein
MKTLKELKGAKELSKKEQKQIAGGYDRCIVKPNGTELCFVGWICVNHYCMPYY